MSGKFLTNIIESDGIILNNTNINVTDTPYTVLITDFAISVDSSGGEVTINLPNPTTMAGTTV